MAHLQKDLCLQSTTSKHAHALASRRHRSAERGRTGSELVARPTSGLGMVLVEGCSARHDLPDAGCLEGSRKSWRESTGHWASYEAPRGAVRPHSYIPGRGFSSHGSTRTREKIVECRRVSSPHQGPSRAGRRCSRGSGRCSCPARRQTGGRCCSSICVPWA